MLNKEKINIAKNDFLIAASNYETIRNIADKADEKFLNIKLAFVAFLGIILALIFDKNETFGHNFLLVIICIFLISFVLLVIDLVLELHGVEKGHKYLQKSLLLSKIRHIAAIEYDKNLIDKFENYGKEAEKIAFRRNSVRQKMKKGVPIEKIIKYRGGIAWKVVFVGWIILFLSVPILFLLKVLGYI